MTSTRTKFVREAEQQFAEKGFYGTSINDVAVALGLSKQALLHHFKTKEKLYATVLEDASEYLIDHIDSAIAAVDDPREQILKICASYDLDDARLLRVSRLLVRELLDNQERVASAQHWYLPPLLKKVENIIITGQKQGVFKDLHAMAFVYQLMGAQQYFFVSMQTLRHMHRDEAEYQSHIANHLNETIRIIKSTLFVSE